MMKVNWPQAFAEIGLLVIGGALALGGDAWMDSRRDLETEHAYLLSLRDDFEETRQLAARYLDQNRRSLAICLELLGVLSGPRDAMSPEPLSQLIKDAFWVYTLEPVRATYLDMVSSGDLDLLRSTELRVDLAQAEEDLQRLETFGDLQWRHWLQLELEFLRQHHDLGLVYPGYVGDAESLNLEIEPLRFPDAGFGPDMNELRSRDFRNIVVARSIVYQDAIVYGTAALRRFEGIFELLDGELRRFQR